jgi:type I restriction enzyme, S subunit
MKMNHSLVELQDICRFISGGTPSTKVPEYFMGSIPWITGADMNGNVITEARQYITEEAIRNSATSIVPKGNILLVTRTGVGKVAIAGVDICISQDFTGLELDKTKVDEWYLFYFLLSQQEALTSQQRGATIQGITRDVVESLRVPLPPLTEQKRIASLLARADRLRQLRRTAHDLGDALLQSVFLEVFGKVRGKTKEVLLGEIADIASGVTKGQNYNGRKTVEVPYLRVANVQDGYLDLSVIKTIQALPSEIEELRLKSGDVVMTEGGDFDKLGRGAIWHGEIENCIHQNHIFRVRLDTSKVIPEFFENYLLSPKAKVYFLMASKQTTNLASINMTQLKQLPVPLYPLSMQEEFAGVVRRVEKMRSRQAETERQVEGLFESLLAEAFS